MKPHNLGWYTQAAPLRFRVAPHFYETWWFRLLVGLGLVGLAVGAWRWRVRRLHRRQEKLEAAVQARTEELAEEKRKTERQAERLAELDEAKNRFFAHVSHEFRTPLSLILSPLRAALRRASNGTASLATDQLRRMISNAERLGRLIDQLLDLATLEAGRMTLDREPGDLAAVVARAADAFRSKAEQKGIDLAVQTPSERIETRFDPEKIETVVSNLVGNALKFTSEGDLVTVRVGESERTGALDPPGGDDAVAGAARIEVADTGSGIDPEAQEQIFDRFAQADSTMTREREGTGLGLALTKELVHLHGGTIEVESTPGEGSRFTVRLPLVLVSGGGESVGERERKRPGARSGDALPLEQGPPERGKEGEVGEERTSGEAATILVVEDNAEMRAYLREQLSDRWAVLEASGGGEGWAAVQEHRPDLVLSDVMIPEIGGCELCRKIKGDPELRTIPVLLLTARAADEDTIEGLESGADDYLSKPFDVQELQQRIANHLASREHVRKSFQEEVRLATLGETVNENQIPFLERVLDAVEANVSNPDFTVDQLAEKVALSRRQLTRRLKDAVGKTPAAFVRQYRIDRAKELLTDRAETIAEVAYAVGFRSPSHFSQVFQEEVGCTPTAYQDEQGS